MDQIFRDDLRLHLGVWLVFALSTLGLIGLFYAYRNVDVWRDWQPSSGFLSPNYAERIYAASIFRTRANTWSNLAYVLVGLYAIAYGCRDWRRGMRPDLSYLRNTPAFSILFGIACVYLGIGSGIFHASLTRWGQQLDVAAMYSPLVVFCAAGIGAMLPRVFRVPTWPALAAASIVVSALLYIYKWQMSSGTVLPLLILATGLTRTLGYWLNPTYRLRWFLLAFAMLVAAVACRQLDVAGRFSGPDAWYQGHALWHLLTGVSLGCMYLYDRTGRGGRITSAP